MSDYDQLFELFQQFNIDTYNTYCENEHLLYTIPHYRASRYYNEFLNKKFHIYQKKPYELNLDFSSLSPLLYSDDSEVRMLGLQMLKRYIREKLPENLYVSYTGTQVKNLLKHPVIGQTFIENQFKLFQKEVWDYERNDFRRISSSTE